MSAFRIVHATFREFLTDSTPYGPGPDFFIDAGETHTHLVDCCTKTLRTFRISQLWKGAILRIRVRNQLVWGNLNIHYLPHVRYACDHLQYHYEHRGSRAPGESASEIQTALDECSKYQTLLAQGPKGGLRLVKGKTRRVEIYGGLIDYVLPRHVVYRTSTL